MNNIKTQGKDHKVVATQQNDACRPLGVIEFTKNAYELLSKTPMSKANREVISNALKAIEEFNGWDNTGLERYEYIAQLDDPEDIREMIKEGEDISDVADCISYEVCTILGDLQNEDFYFDEEELEEALEAISEYLDIIHEYELQDLFEWGFFTECDKVRELHR